MTDYQTDIVPRLRRLAGGQDGIAKGESSSADHIYLTRTVATCREAASTIEGLREAAPPSRDALVPGHDDEDAAPPRRDLHRRWLRRIGSDLWVVAVGSAAGASVALVWICGEV